MTGPALRTALVLSLLFAATPASADEKAACVTASEKAQQLRNAGKLGQAREQLLVCGRTECPKLIQTDCTQWMREVLEIMPSVVPAAKDRRGRDIVDVKVSVDGQVAAESLDGKPIAVDPGVHTFRFEAKGAPAVEEQIVVRQGEKNRLVMTTIAIGEEPAEPEGSAGPTGGAAALGDGSGGERGLPIPAIIVGGLGLAGGGVALYVGLSADADGRNLRDTCSPKCNPSDVQDVELRQNLARIIGVASGVVFAAGVVLLVLHYTGGKGRAGQRQVPGWTLTPAANGEATILRF